jgi:hypothetical protein
MRRANRADLRGDHRAAAEAIEAARAIQKIIIRSASR